MAFIVYDLFLLAVFVIFVSFFLYSGRKNLKKEGLLFLYRAAWGIKLINYVGNKYKRTLKFLSYISVGLGYVLMIAMIYLIARIVWIYMAFPSIVQAIKVPPIMPLIPYIDKVIDVPFLPPFYFIYWIIILAVVAITHEFAHGIFAAYDKIKIKSTGFGFFPFFLPIFLAAFVELDEEKMAKKDKFTQLTILSAGTFANVLTAIFFFAVIWVFFSLAFSPSGVVFDNYAYSVIGISNISMINGIQLEDPSYEGVLSLMEEAKLNEIKSGNRNYLSKKDFLENQKDNQGLVVLYDDAPAINYDLEGAIMEIDGIKIDSIASFREELLKNSPGDEIVIKTKYEGELSEYEIVLGKNPKDENLPWLGVGFVDQSRSGILGKIYASLSSFKEPNVFYEPKFNGISWFIYNLLWWLILISISVALVNMLPVGIFDGGRFFYLTIWGITGSEKKAKKLFAFSTYFILFLVLLLMIFWFLALF